MAREYDKYGDRWDRANKTFEHLCKGCHSDLCPQPRGELEKLLGELEAGNPSQAEFLSRYVATVDDRYGPLEESRCPPIGKPVESPARRSKTGPSVSDHRSLHPDTTFIPTSVLLMSDDAQADAGTAEGQGPVEISEDLARHLENKREELFEKFEIRDEFPDEVLEEAEDRTQDVQSEITGEIDEREDLRELTTWTTDPIDAQDFDDALRRGARRRVRPLGSHRRRHPLRPPRVGDVG